MADKKMTAAEKRAAEETAAEVEAGRKAMERKRLIGAGAVLAALALFVGGYAVGSSADDDDTIIGSDVVFGEPRDRSGPFGDGRGDHFPGPGGGFDLPEGFEFPPDFDFPEGFEFPPDHEGGFGFDFPEEFEFPRGRGAFGFGFECIPAGDLPGGFRCEFTFPDDFEFPFPPGPLFDDELPSDEPPAAGDMVPAEPGFLGVQVVETPRGVVVATVLGGSPAAEAGIEADDRIIAVDDFAVESVDQLVDVITDAGAGTEVVVTVLRSGEELAFEVLLGVDRG